MVRGIFGKEESWVLSGFQKAWGRMLGCFVCGTEGCVAGSSGEIGGLIPSDFGGVLGLGLQWREEVQVLVSGWISEEKKGFSLARNHSGVRSSAGVLRSSGFFSSPPG